MADEKKPQEETKSVKKLNEPTRVVDEGAPALNKPEETDGENLLSSNGACANAYCP